MVTNRIKEIRNTRKMTQKELAQKTGLSQSHIAMLESGERSLDLDLMVSISKELNVKPYELMPAEMQPEEITLEEREILRMIRKSTAPQGADNNHIPSQASVEKLPPQPSQPPHKSNER